MYDTSRDMSRLKKIGWSNHNFVGGSNFNSVHSILNHYKHKTDFNKIAAKCSINPNHEMFGKTTEEIQEIWEEKGNVGKRRGRYLDSYIHKKLHNIKFDDEVEALEDVVMVEKFKHFDKFKLDVLDKTGMVPVSNELWVNSSKYRIRGKFDELFYIEEGFNGYVLVDWKNNEKIKMDSGNMMKGCLSHLPSCDLYHFYLQLYIYMFLLRTEYKLNCKGGRVIQISERNYKLLNTPEDFQYDEELIRKVIVEFNDSI